MCVSSRCVYLNDKKINKKNIHRYFLFRCNKQVNQPNEN